MFTSFTEILLGLFIFIDNLAREAHCCTRLIYVELLIVEADGLGNGRFLPSRYGRQIFLRGSFRYHIRGEIAHTDKKEQSAQMGKLLFWVRG
jgi:hypothetical protein